MANLIVLLYNISIIIQTSSRSLARTTIQILCRCFMENGKERTKLTRLLVHGGQDLLSDILTRLVRALVSPITKSTSVVLISNILINSI